MTATDWAESRDFGGEQWFDVEMGRGDWVRPVRFSGIHAGQRVVGEGYERFDLYAARFDVGHWVWVVHTWTDGADGVVQSLERICGAELEVGGQWEMLGHAAGVCRPLSLCEALEA